MRLFSILDRLRVKSLPVSAETLALDLNVSVRTIYRDMATLQAMGAPIRGESSVGYQMEKGYFLPPLHFDPDELDALVLGMQLISRDGDKVLADAADRVIAKITAILLEKDKDKLHDNSLLVCSGVVKKSVPLPFLNSLRTNLRNRQKLHLIYQDEKQHKTSRTIRPLGLTIFNDVWLLTTWCELRADFRNFRVDRILNVKPTGDKFPPEKGKEFRDFLQTL